MSVTPAATTVDRVEQTVVHVDSPRKRDMLVELFADPKLTRTIVFTRTKHGADRVASTLDKAGVSALAIRGQEPGPARARPGGVPLGGQARALVATDIAARGINVDNVSHVVNFELPKVAEAYVHRIGRTARAGKGGQAISLCDAGERNSLRAIERLTRLRIFSLDRRGDKGPKPAPVVRKAATEPAPERPHHSPQRDPRSANRQPHRARQGRRARPAFRPRRAGALSRRRWTTPPRRPIVDGAAVRRSAGAAMRGGRRAICAPRHSGIGPRRGVADRFRTPSTPK